MIVNNIHPAVTTNHGEAPRTRHSSGYPVHGSQHNQPIENGLPTESNQTYTSHPRRSPAISQPQPSPNVR